jgi:hypothetical protein
MAFEMKTTLALISFLVIGFLIYPMVSTTQWDKLEFNSPRSETAASASAPLDWRALISE